MSDNEEVRTVVKYTVFPTNGSNGLVRQISLGLEPMFLIEPEAEIDENGEEVIYLKFTSSQLGNDITEAVDMLTMFVGALQAAVEKDNHE